MATWIEILGYTSTGTVLGILVKSIFDALHTERAHTLELRRHFFDKKLEITIKGLTDAKMATASLRSFCALFKKAMVNPGTIHPKVLSGMMKGFGETAERLKQSDLSASASFGFLYGKLFFNSDKEMRNDVLRITELMSQIFRQFDTLPELLTGLKNCEKDTDLVTAFIESLSPLISLVNQLDSEAQSLDEKLDNFTEKASASFGKLRL